MKAKKIFGLLILFSLIFFIAGVSASDVDSTITQDLDSAEDSISADANTGAILTDNLNGSFTNLNEEIKNSSTGELKLDKNYVYGDADGDLKDGIDISKPITIDGQGHTIDANSSARIFFITSEDVTLKNITFINGWADYGSFKIWKSNVSIIDCKFIDCGSSEEGGAIYWDGTDLSNLTIANCEFENCYSREDTGAIFAYGSDAIIDNCVFTNCYSLNDAGVIYLWGSNNTVSNSEFRNSSSKKNAGVIYVDGDENSIINCIFEDSKIESYYGGAIYVYDGDYNKISNCNFTNSYAPYGGAIYIETHYVDIVNCNFEKSTSNQYGGAIYVNGIGNKITSCNFKDSEANRGTVYIVAQENKIDDCNFTNSTGNQGSAIYISSVNCTVFNCNFNDCYASEQSTVHVSWQGAVVYNCKFLNCYAERHVAGVYFGSDESCLDSCVFTNCTSDGSNMGGAVLFDGSNNVVTNCNFTDASSKWYGGAICFGGNNNILYNSNFINCYAQYYGGAVYFRYSNNLVDKSNFKDCSAGSTGGAVYFVGSNNTISNSDFTNCAANTMSGGGACFSGSNSTVTSSSFTGCSAKYCGGGIYFVKDDFTISDLTFKDNSAQYGPNYYPTGSSTKSTTIAASAVTTVYNGGKYIVATLKDDQGNPLSDVTLTAVFSNGKTVSANTDKNGQAKLTTNALAPKTSYTATITFAGNAYYAKSTKAVKVTVKKATPKLTASAKNFKQSDKTKKYYITLKTNQNKVMKNAKVTLKVNGVTYSAKTGATGKATFKLTKLTKKGTFKAVITYNGNTYYNKVTKKVTIKSL